jgi:hypothetical protein
MNWAMSQVRFDMAEERVLYATKQVARQREIVARFESNGLDAGRPKKLLAELEKILALQVAERDHLLQPPESITPSRSAPALAATGPRSRAERRASWPRAKTRPAQARRQSGRTTSQHKSN